MLVRSAPSRPGHVLPPDRQSPLRLATRLVLGSSVVVAVVMTIYGITSLQQRRQLITDALVRETETLTHAMQIVANSSIRNDQMASLDRVLGRILRDPEMAVSAVLDSEGRVLAGGPRDLLECVDTLFDRHPRPAELHVWADCTGRVRLIVLPLQPPAQSLVLARRTTVVERDMASSERRIALTTVVLALLASLAIVVVLRFALTRPLSEIMVGVHRLGGPLPPQPVRVPSSARELQNLALAFNEMVERLNGKQQSLIRETEERIELERRLRQAETFAALGRLSGGMAHELGSPLGVIGMRAEAIQRDAASQERVRRHAEEIAAEVERITGLVRDLLYVARRHGVSPAPVDLVAVVRGVAEDLRRDAEQAGITVIVQTPPQGLTVPGDPVLLRHALFNVVVNAVQALRDHTGDRRLALSVQQAGARARVVVEDSGPGVPEDHYPYLTEPFFTTKDVGEGSGLGLSISAGIVEEHGGSLTLAPSAGGGVRAHIDLPVNGAPEEKPA